MQSLTLPLSCSCMYINPDPMPLTLGDLSEVYEKVYSSRPKWYNFGLALELPPATLDSIGIKYREDPSDCLREMIKARLKIENPLMWREIIRALRKPTVGESKLADQLEREYDPQEPLSAEVTSNQSESLLAFSLLSVAGSQASAEGEKEICCTLWTCIHFRLAREHTIGIFCSISYSSPGP